MKKKKSIDKKIKIEKSKIVLFKEVKHFEPDVRYLIHLKYGDVKFAYYYNLENLISANPIIKELSKEELESLPKEYFLTESFTPTYCLRGDIEAVYTASDFKIYNSDNQIDG